ncbi:MAG: DUF484 family protein [Limnohabitans sp.]
MSDTPAIPPITEDDIAQYLLNTPDFFERHASLLAEVQLTHPQSHRTVSLQERQALMLRDKIRSLEHRIVDMIRHGHENMILSDKLHRWACEMLAARREDLTTLALDNIRDIFQVPQVALRLWDLASTDALGAVATPVDDSVRTLAQDLATPYVGPVAGHERLLAWLDAPAQAASLALLALRPAPGGTPFGLLVLASPDAQRFNPQMGTELLERLAELAGAALSGLQEASHGATDQP